MRHPLLIAPLLAVAVLALAGCGEDHKTNPVPPPAAPRGLFSVTGDHQVRLVWMSNTESDVVAYRVYKSTCATGPDCDYVQIATVPATDEPYVTFLVTGLDNGVTRYFAVDAVNHGGGFSELSIDDVQDTPRPAGRGLVLNNFRAANSHDFGYDFSAFARTDSTGPPSDIYYGFYEDALGYAYHQIIVPDDTDIQDAGYADSGLDQVDVASTQGWSPTKMVEAIPGHNYVVWTWDNHFAKFRVTAVDGASVTLDWAYQTDAGNTQLRARPAAGGSRQPLAGRVAD